MDPDELYSSLKLVLGQVRVSRLLTLLSVAAHDVFVCVDCRLIIIRTVTYTFLSGHDVVISELVS